MPIASGSKWVSGTVVYAVMEHPLTNFTPSSLPSDYFAFWTCADVSDLRCTSITVEKLLAFRSGLEINGCEYEGPSWEDCVEAIFSKPYKPSRFDDFEYGPVGLAVAGLMALKEMQKLPGYANATWDDLLEEFVLDPSGILSAPKFSSSLFFNGDMTYDYNFNRKRIAYTGDFPGLSGTYIYPSCLKSQDFVHFRDHGMFSSTIR